MAAVKYAAKSFMETAHVVDVIELFLWKSIKSTFSLKLKQ